MVLLVEFDVVSDDTFLVARRIDVHSFNAGMVSSMHMRCCDHCEPMDHARTPPGSAKPPIVMLRGILDSYKET
jgi:hypothetical protein